MINLKDYQEFVLSTTSWESKSPADFIERLDTIGNNPIAINPSLLLTAAIGMASESGEFSEIVKKVMFQGKFYNGEVREHLIRELGDVLWYVANAATSLGMDLEDVIRVNIDKLSARYPDGFEAVRSEEREEDDL